MKSVRQGLYTGMQITAHVIPTVPFAYHNEVSLNYSTLPNHKKSCQEFEDSGVAVEYSLSTLYLIPAPISRHNAVTTLLQIFELLKKNIKSGCVNSFFFKEYNLVVTENTVTEINGRIWIIDAILLFLSGKYDLQLEQNEPRCLEKMLQDQRPESISTKEVNKSQRQELSSS